MSCGKQLEAEALRRPEISHGREQVAAEECADTAALLVTSC
jgi:hypothetical protein